ncbi:MAG: FAD-dependent monooxygenase [Verrucomicrobiota bacterium JB022]|nr:FAD-dependent monooxygenase [Verrucomicrobiota bacterium JB022]
MASEETATDWQVLIVGAGPVGLTLALALARAGIRVAVVEKEASQQPAGQALALHSRMLEILSALGLGEEIRKHGVPVHEIRVHSQEHQLFAHNLKDLESPWPEVRDIQQGLLIQILERAALGAGAQVWRGWQLNDFIYHPQYAEVVLEHAGEERIINTEYLVGCDGRNSTVRELLDLALEPQGAPERVWVAELELSNGPPLNEWQIYCHPEGGAALFPMGGADFRVILQLAPNAEGPESQYQAEMLLAERTQSWIGVRQLKWNRTVEIQPAMAESFHRGRVMLVGDAAHVMPVMGNQGMNLGVQDAFNLAWKLHAVLRGQLPPSLLETYETERKAAAKRTLGFTAQLSQLAGTPSLLKRTLRNWILPAVSGLHLARQQLLDYMETAPSLPGHDFLHVESRSKSLGSVANRRFKNGSMVGDLLPDTHLLDFSRNTHLRLRDWQNPQLWNLFLVVRTQADRETIQAIQELTSASILPEWMQVALICGRIVPAELRQLPCPVFTDAREKLQERLGFPESGLVLVRPDGHIAYRQAPVTQEDWVHYLRRLQRGR